MRTGILSPPNLTHFTWNLAADKENEIVLYVLASGRHRCENWTNVTIPSDDLALDDQSSSGTNYEKLLRQITRRNGGHVFVTEFALATDTVGFRPLLETITGEDPMSSADRVSPEPPAVYLTRLRAVVAPEAMDRDVILVPDQGGDVGNEHFLYANPAARNTAGVAATALLPAGPWFGLRLLRRRRRETRVRSSRPGS